MTIGLSSGAHRRRRLSFAMIAALIFLTGCANGDFGEVKPSLVRDDVHDWLDRDTTAGIRVHARFELTDDERLLRDLAYPLLEAPYDRQQFYSIAGEYGLTAAGSGKFDRTSYATRLMTSRYRSTSARYSQLIDDERNDATRVPAFFETSARVLDIDIKRRKSFAYVSGITPSERANALRRMDDNASIVRMVRVSLDQRIAGYHFALERLVIATPSPQAVQAEQTLNQLKAVIASYRHGAPISRSHSASLGRPF